MLTQKQTWVLGAAALVSLGCAPGHGPLNRPAWELPVLHNVTVVEKQFGANAPVLAPQIQERVAAQFAERVGDTTDTHLDIQDVVVAEYLRVGVPVFVLCTVTFLSERSYDLALFVSPTSEFPPDDGYRFDDASDVPQPLGPTHEVQRLERRVSLESALERAPNGRLSVRVQ